MQILSRLRESENLEFVGITPGLKPGCAAVRLQVKYPARAVAILTDTRSQENTI